jgi:hypothetical protein
MPWLGNLMEDKSSMLMWSLRFPLLCWKHNKVWVYTRERPVPEYRTEHST